jgi:hypothetical protein
MSETKKIIAVHIDNFLKRKNMSPELQKLQSDLISYLLDARKNLNLPLTKINSRVDVGVKGSGIYLIGDELVVSEAYSLLERGSDIKLIGLFEDACLELLREHAIIQRVQSVGIVKGLSMTVAQAKTVGFFK